MIVEETDYLEHYGILRRSGRYPWGSGGNEVTRSRRFLDVVDDMRKQGFSDVDIARSFSTDDVPFTTSNLRQLRTLALAYTKQADIAMAQKLAAKGMSRRAIGEQMGGRNESYVRSLLIEGQKDRQDAVRNTAEVVRRAIQEKGVVDVGAGVNRHLGVTETKFKTALSILREEGYNAYYMKVPQLGTRHETSIKVLAEKDMDWSTANKKIKDGELGQIFEYSNDGGRSFLGIYPPLDFSSKRLAIRYGGQGGEEADGTMYIRPGVKDLDIGENTYAQVRIQVDGTHYLKGMAVYKSDLPAGVDIMFNTPKKDTGNKLDALKALKDDPDNPFGATVRQIIEKGPDGKERVTSVMNIVGNRANELSGAEGSWGDWSKNLPSQFLSKQSPQLAEAQLKKEYLKKKASFDEINELTNPLVKKKLMESFADSADSSAITLKAASMKDQATHVILPVSSMKDTEVYAPKYENGTRVVLVRFPHAGTFEIPELVVNNKNREAKSLLGNAKDAVGINSRVAERLSGADFDGDTVLVIPNDSGKVKSSPPLAGLKGFDKDIYKGPPGMPKMSDQTKGLEMGKISNLISDMSLGGASNDELARAVKHSMVVIDAQKHGLDYKRSAEDHGIRDLTKKYQKGPYYGASTLISRSGDKSFVKIPERKPRPARDDGPVDPKTGKLVYVETGNSYINRNGKTVLVKDSVPRLGYVDDAHKLSSGTKMEAIYADHSNRMKSLANEARKVAVNTKNTPASPSARAAYKTEVDSLTAKLNVALKNAPRERLAQVKGNHVYRQKLEANPLMDEDSKKRLRAQALDAARIQTGAWKERIDITPSEWNAIQAGAISNKMLEDILRNTDVDVVKKYATPKTPLLMSASRIARARTLLANGATQAEAAAALGVSVTTLKEGLK